MKKIKIASMWDDGLATDLRLMDLLRKLNAPACFAIAPATHKKSRTLNDHRDSCYGEKAAISELKEFSDFEICNHSAHHVDLSAADEATTREEIRVGRLMLEDIFCREIDGFCYPYGRWNGACRSALVENRHLYGRTTKMWPSLDQNDLYLFKPACKWDDSRFWDIVGRAKRAGMPLLFFGHTYELTGPKEWDAINSLYKMLLDDSELELVSVKDLVLSVSR